MNTLLLKKTVTNHGTVYDPVDPDHIHVMRHFVGADIGSINEDGLKIVKQVASIHGWHVVLDPEEMNVRQAMAEVSNGRCVRRRSWHDKLFIAPTGSPLKSNTTINDTDLNATDWVVVTP